MTSCRLRRGRIEEISGDLELRGDEAQLDGGGGALIPGLADHHVHPLAMTAARASLDLGGGGLPAEAQLGGCGWLRVVGLGEPASRSDLDAVWPGRPVRVQHRSGAMWALNSAAIELVGRGLSREERDTGQLWRADDRLRALVAEQADPRSGLAQTGRMLAALGVTHLTDASPGLGPEMIELMSQAIPQRLTFMSEHVAGPPRKVVLDDRNPAALSELVRVVAEARDAGRAVAFHAVSAAQIAIVIATLAAVGASEGDRVEHAAICDDAAAERLAELGVVVVTQPTIAMRHGERYYREVEPHERALLWRYDGLLRRGVRVVASSDAPYGDANPWRTIHDATSRRLPDGAIMGADEIVSPGAALRSFLTEAHDPAGTPRRVEEGAVADLCLLSGTLDSALELAAADGRAMVAATFIAGRRVYCASESSAAGAGSEAASAHALAGVPYRPTDRREGRFSRRARSRQVTVK